MLRFTLLWAFVVWQAGSLHPVPIYQQLPDVNGGLIPSSRVSNPNGSDNDQYVWDSFILSSNRDITEIQWWGGYDPQQGGSGGPVVDFIVSIYPSLQGGTQPDVVNPPLMQYDTANDAGQTPAGVYGGIQMYSYHFVLPTAFTANSGTKYWLQIEAVQSGLPDWGLLKGTGGDSSYFRRITNLGDTFYQVIHGSEPAFTLLIQASHAIWLPTVMWNP